MEASRSPQFSLIKGKNCFAAKVTKLLMKKKIDTQPTDSIIVAS